MIKNNYCCFRYDCLPHIPIHKQSQNDCQPFDNTTRERNLNFCWNNDENSSDYQIRCYYGLDPFKKIPGYKLVHEDKKNDGKLNLDKETLPYYWMQPQSKDKCRSVLDVKVEHYTNHLRVLIKYSNDTTASYINAQYLNFSSVNNESNGQVNWQPDLKKHFVLQVQRNSPHKVLFDTIYSPLIYCENYIEITTLLSNDLIYGLGQSPMASLKHNFTFPQKWNIFSKDYSNVTSDEKSWFGSFPFYMGLDGDNKGSAYGVLLLNTNPIEIVTNSRPSLTYRILGGDLDLHFFMGPKPEDVIKQLTEYIGKPMLPPFWSLGFHLCRTTCDLEDAKIIANSYNNSEFPLPIESDCGSSLLYSNSISKPDFDLRKIYGRSLFVNFPQIATDSSIYKENRNNELFLKNETNDYIGKIKAFNCINKNRDTEVVYLDYFKKSNEMHKKLLVDFKDTDGVMLDLNTPFESSTVEGDDSEERCNKNSSYNTPFLSPSGISLYENTVCMDVKTSDGKLRHMNFHNIYGYQHAKSINDYLQEIQKRKFIISLSTFIGSGKYAGHWGGHIPATWEMLKQTLIQTLQFNLYGIPLVGFPVCGFKEISPDDELCIRWYQLAAFQPLMLSHRGFEQNLTDPFNIAKYNPKTLEVIRNVISLRYQLLPYLYTLFYKANSEGGMVIKPLFFEFPEDHSTYKIDEQFLWGSALLISPVVRFGAKSLKAYFPKGYWYDYYSGKKIIGKGEHHELTAFEYHVNLHIREGFVIATQKEGRNTNESRNTTFTLISALDKENQAQGQLYIDDGIGNDKNGISTNIQVYKKDDYFININSTGKFQKDLICTKIESIKIYGTILEPDVLHVNEQIHKNITFIPEFGALIISNLDIDLNQEKHTLKWSVKKYN